MKLRAANIILCGQTLLETTLSLTTTESDIKLWCVTKKLKKKEFILTDYFPHSCILQKNKERKISILFWKKDSTQHSSEPHVKNECYAPSKFNKSEMSEGMIYS